MKIEKDKMLSPTELVKARFGGTNKLAKLLNIPSSSVSRWAITGKVPQKHRITLLNYARTLNIPLTSHELDFGGML